MKKFISTVLALGMAVSLAACGAAHPRQLLRKAPQLPPLKPLPTATLPTSKARAK